jgi:hypothetical protein
MDELPQLLEDAPQATWQIIWFMHNWASACFTQNKVFGLTLRHCSSQKLEEMLKWFKILGAVLQLRDFIIIFMLNSTLKHGRFLFWKQRTLLSFYFERYEETSQ